MHSIPSPTITCSNPSHWARAFRPMALTLYGVPRWVTSPGISSTFSFMACPPSRSRSKPMMVARLSPVAVSTSADTLNRKAPSVNTCPPWACAKVKHPMRDNKVMVRFMGISFPIGSYFYGCTLLHKMSCCCAWTVSSQGLSLKALRLSCSRLCGRETYCRLSQLAKAWSPMLLVPSGISTRSR